MFFIDYWENENERMRLVTPNTVQFTRSVHDATTRIKVIIFSIATYLDLNSQARIITDPGAVLPVRLLELIHNCRLHIIGSFLLRS